MKKHTIILDCDPGLDDAVSLLLAMASPDKLTILGITTVAGNVEVEQTQRNARILCDLAGQYNVAVYAGCSRPLFREAEFASHVHGASGLATLDIFPPKTPLRPQHAVDFIIETLNQAAPQSITLVPSGPLSNIAMALMKAPHLTSKIQQIVLMGGSAREGGNVTPAAEFNIYADPHAADIVFRSGCPIVVMGLDVTHQALPTQERLAPLYSSSAAKAPLLKTLFEDMNAAMAQFGQELAALHDPCTVAYLIAPELFQGHPAHVAIETQSELTMGATVVDFALHSKNAPNATWITSVDADTLFDLVIGKILTNL